jgi:hypothetical protein
MRKTSLLLVLGVALVLASAAAPKASAGVVVGVAAGAPAYPVHAYGYVAPGYVARPYFVPRPYVAFVPAPVYPRVYVAPEPVYYRQWYPRR